MSPSVVQEQKTFQSVVWGWSSWKITPCSYGSMVRKLLGWGNFKVGLLEDLCLAFFLFTIIKIDSNNYCWLSIKLVPEYITCLSIATES